MTEEADTLTVEQVEDEAAADTEADVLPLYKISAYGVDFDVTSLINRLDKEDIEFPNFQRGFIWSYRQASRFIESLLMGLPVPGVFLWRNPETEKLVVVDGRQRLETLQSYYRGTFKGREFSLPDHTSPYQRVNPKFQERTYRRLDEDDRRRLDNSVIHATIVSQERPPEQEEGEETYSSSIYYLFERINTEGTPLQPQEIRTAIYRGELVDLLGRLNGIAAWREIYGPPSARLKDRELIVRFFALFYRSGMYARPMKEFINRYFSSNRNLSRQSEDQLTELFGNTINTVSRAIGARAFRPEKALNAAVYDAVMVGVARRLEKGNVDNPDALKTAYDGLIVDPAFEEAYTKATSDAPNVLKRLQLATDAFAEVP